MVARGRELGYDVLVLAFGSRATILARRGLSNTATSSTAPDQADAFDARLRAHVVRSFAEGRNIDIAIVGGGATGVELAAELSRTVELAGLRHTMRAQSKSLRAFRLDSFNCPMRIPTS